MRQSCGGIKRMLNQVKIKQLTKSIFRKSGRNNFGRITVRHRRSGAKKIFRTLNRFYSLVGEEATVSQISRDPNRSSFIGLIRFKRIGVLSYMTLPRNIDVGYVFKVEKKFKPGSRYKTLSGYSYPLKTLPTSIPLYNVEIRPGCGGQVARAAGTSAQIVRKLSPSKRTKGAGCPVFIGLGLPSGKTLFVSGSCYGTIGKVSNQHHHKKNLMLAGTSYHKGWRPSVRGVAMNPVDHPHGGGEGKTSGGRPSVSPWGHPTKGAKTRSRKKKLAEIKLFKKMRRK